MSFPADVFLVMAMGLACGAIGGLIGCGIFRCVIGLLFLITVGEWR